MKRLLVLLVILAAVSGCSMRVADFTVLCAQNIDVENCAYEIDKTRRVSGTDTAFVFVIIPFGLPDYETAVADAVKRIPDCVGLANVAVEYNYFWLGLGYTEFEAVGCPILRKREAK